MTRTHDTAMRSGGAKTASRCSPKGISSSTKRTSPSRSRAGGTTSSARRCGSNCASAKTGKEFFFFNTHLAHRASPVEGGDIDQVARSESVKLIVEQMKQIAGRYAPIFVTGDMNASYAAGDGRRTCLDGFFEFMWSARETAPDGEADDVYSYNNFGEGTPRFTWNIDHIFYRKVTPVRFRTINNDGYGVPYISDHFPILFTSEF